MSGAPTTLRKTDNMSIGYSARLIQLNEEAGDCYRDCRLGVELGKFCIEHDIPVAQVATELGVSRQTIYNWFVGLSAPSEQTTKGIRTFITSST